MATTRRLYPAAVGDDIGCGVAAVGLGCEAGRLREETARTLLAELRRRVPTLRHRGRSAARLPPELEEHRLSQPSLESEKKRTAVLQLGTLGRGNHFVEFQEDDEGAMWLMVHSGSRSLGQSIRQRHERQARRDEGGLAWLDAEDEPGRAYLGDVQWALSFAEANRRRIVDQVVALAAQHLDARADPGTLVTGTWRRGWGTRRPAPTRTSAP